MRYALNYFRVFYNKHKFLKFSEEVALIRAVTPAQLCILAVVSERKHNRPVSLLSYLKRFKISRQRRCVSLLYL